MRSTTSNPGLYGRDLAYIQELMFSQFSEQAAEQIIHRLRQSDRPLTTVVDVGCGAGTSTRLLIEAGFTAIAIEPSRALLEIAQRKARRASFIKASAYDVDIPQCDAVIAVGEPLTYHEPDSDASERLGQFFQSVHSALPPGGALIFDLIVSGQESLDRETWSAADDWALLVQTTEDHESRRLTREITVFRKRVFRYRRTVERHAVHVFDEHKISALLRRSGFDVQVDSKYGSIDLLTRRRAFFATRRP